MKFLLKSVTLKIWALLLIIVLINVATNSATYYLGTKAGFKYSTKASGQTLENVSGTLDKAIEKETIKNEVTNNNEVNIDKVKKSDSLVIEFKPNTATDQKPDNKIVAPKKDDCIDVKELSKRELKRLRRRNVIY